MVKTNSTMVYIFVVVVLFLNTTMAKSLVTVESGAIANVKTAMRYYEEWNGRPATNWAQVNEIINLDQINRGLGDTPIYPLQEHYVFPTNKIPLLDHNEGDVVLIRTAPVEEAERTSEGRYVVARNRDGFHYTWIAETNVQKMLAAAGVTELPKPEPFNPPGNQIPSAGISQSRQEPQATTPVAVSNTSPDHQGTASVPDKNITPEPLPTGEPNTNSASPESATSPSLKWLMLGVLVVFGGGFVFLLFRNKSR